MKVAITGATGGLGRSTCEYLVAQGYEVVALGRNAAVGASLKGVEFREGTIDDETYLRSAFHGCDAIVHCAGLASPVGTWSSFFEANVEGTRHVLEAARGVRVFVHISTPSIYYDGRDRVGVLEDFLPARQSSSYGRSKLMADELVFSAARANRETSFVLLRPRAIVGPYDQTIVPRLMKLIRGGRVPLPNGGRSLIDLTAAVNVAHAIDLALRSSRVFHGEVFNITNEQPQSLRSLVELLTRAVGLSPRLISIPMWVLKPLATLSEWIAREGAEPAISKYAVGSIGTSQVLSTEKARDLLGYRPIVSLEDALLEVVARLGTKV